MYVLLIHVFRLTAKPIYRKGREGREEKKDLPAESPGPQSVSGVLNSLTVHLSLRSQRTLRKGFVLNAECYSVAASRILKSTFAPSAFSSACTPMAADIAAVT